MAQIIDLFNLIPATRSLLANLLIANKNKTTFAKGSHWVNDEEIILSHRIIMHLNSNATKNVYEVLDDNLYGKGCFGELYLSLVTLVFEENTLIAKIRPEEKQRLVKAQPLKYVSKEQAEREVSNLTTLGFFHCKPLTIDDAQSYITMRKLPGVPLKVLIEANQLTIQQRYNLTCILVQTYKEQIMEKGLIHRDINPGNILINEQFVTHFVDAAFAIPKGYDDSRDHHGAIPYAAPECYSLYENSTVKTDIYALARVLMLVWGDDMFGNPDFRPTDVIWTAKHPSFATLFSRMDEIPTCHEEIRSLLRSMMHEDAFERADLTQIFTTLDGLANQLTPIANPDKTTFVSSVNSAAPVKVDSESNETPSELSNPNVNNYYTEDDEEGYNAYYGFT
ncbi:protein kinase domain-containing protein [Legionella clemsonensis]|uniref:Serine/threonine-protein kinase PknH n=1 Tax=Legionella clemsonensis TaxID=1867846 RepID=A0A222P5U6_9GAMM|nr:protein kinase [Legionella clemsonensis]ASQ47193.1 Serine/threonine-protein kinase PknH [Legionella clemsonensis]